MGIKNIFSRERKPLDAPEAGDGVSPIASELDGNTQIHKKQKMILAGGVVSCPLLSGPSTMTVWIKEGTTNACQEAQARGDHREAA